MADKMMNDPVAWAADEIEGDTLQRLYRVRERSVRLIASLRPYGPVNGVESLVRSLRQLIHGKASVDDVTEGRLLEIGERIKSIRNEWEVNLAVLEYTQNPCPLLEEDQILFHKVGIWVGATRVTLWDE